MSDKTVSSLRILISPLDWGLGHASRLVPIIRKYQSSGYEILLGGNGFSLELLKNEFPVLEFVSIPFTEIRYSEGENQIFRFISSISRYFFALLREHRTLHSIIAEKRIDIVISDNRLGLFSKKAKCILITHQLWLSMPRGWGLLKFFANRFNHYFIRKFDECWVVDSDQLPNIAGNLSHPPVAGIPVRYIGPLSRFTDCKPVGTKKIEILVILSGPEPQRTNLEEILIRQISVTTISTVIVGGTTDVRIKGLSSNIRYIPFAAGDLLNELVQSANIIICRSGYSSVMDMIALGRSAILIPTPGQPEQEYLGASLSAKKYFINYTQVEFNLQTALSAWGKFEAQIPCIQFNQFPQTLNFQ